MNKNFDRTFHYFRAFAILSILGAHMWIAPVVEGLEAERKFLDCLRSALFHSGTIYFIFISGYLFDYVYKTRPFELLKFYRSKVKNVLAPYLFLSALLIAVSILLHCLSQPVPYFINHGRAMTTLPAIADALVFGRACITYWYIPFILTVYVVSPLLFSIRDRNFLVLVALSSLLPLFIQRDELTDFFRNYCFFYPVFILGVFFSRHRDACLAFLSRHCLALACAAVLLTLVVMHEFYDPLLPNVEIAYYLQRLAIGGLVILGLEHLPFDSRLLDLLATYSFPLYFLHDIVIALTQSLFFRLGFCLPGAGPFVVSVFAFCLELLVCLGLALLIKRLCGSHSRQIIGA